MREIAPGIVHWTARHPNIGEEVSSYLLARAHSGEARGSGGVLLNPMLPPDGLEALREGPAPPSDVVLTNRHHVRDVPRYVEAFGCRVYVPAAGVQEVREGGLDAVGYAPGDELPGGMEALEVGVLSADEIALHVPWARAIAFADGLIRQGDGPLAFVPDHLLGPDPEGVKTGLLERFEALAELEPEHLLLAHGEPVVGGGAGALRDFVVAAAR